MMQKNNFMGTSLKIYFKKNKVSINKIDKHKISTSSNIRIVDFIVLLIFFTNFANDLS